MFQTLKNKNLDPETTLFVTILSCLPPESFVNAQKPKKWLVSRLGEASALAKYFIGQPQTHRCFRKCLQKCALMRGLLHNLHRSLFFLLFGSLFLDKIIANPNLSTIQMIVALIPLHQSYQIKALGYFYLPINYRYRNYCCTTA